MAIRYVLKETLPPSTTLQDAFGGIWVSEVKEAKDVREVRQVVLAGHCNLSRGCERWAETEDQAHVIFGVKFNGKTFGGI